MKPTMMFNGKPQATAQVSQHTVAYGLPLNQTPINKHDITVPLGGSAQPGRVMFANQSCIEPLPSTKKITFHKPTFVAQAQRNTM